MRSSYTPSILIIICLLLCMPVSSYAATEPRIALIVEETATPSVNCDNEQFRIESEWVKLREGKELPEQKEALAEERQKLEERKMQLAMGKRPSGPAANEVKRDGRFTAYDDNTVLDTKTNLMWAAKDNGVNINWSDARKYCDSYKGGDYDNWRMPTKDELEELYDSSITNTSPPTGECSGGYHLTNLIHLTCCCVWAAEVRDSRAACFTFDFPATYDFPQTIDTTLRALPVRNAK
jgi:hypothetical protein